MRRRLPEPAWRRRVAWLMTERRLADLERERRAEWDEAAAVADALMRDDEVN